MAPKKTRRGPRPGLPCRRKNFVDWVGATIPLHDRESGEAKAASLFVAARGASSYRTGDAVGWLLNATLGNLTELVIALAALRACQYMLVKASVAGAIVANTLFMLGASFLIDGLKHHLQEYNRVNARFQAGLLFPGYSGTSHSVGSWGGGLGWGSGVHSKVKRGSGRAAPGDIRSGAVVFA